MAKATTRKTTATKTATRKTSTTAKRKTTTAVKPSTTKPEALQAAKAPVSAPAPIAPARKVDPVVVKMGGTASEEAVMRKEQLLDLVAERSGAKRKDAKPIVEAALAVLGEALGDARELNLKPLGKVKVARTKVVGKGRVINLRVRQSELAIKELDELKAVANKPDAAE